MFFTFPQKKQRSPAKNAWLEDDHAWPLGWSGKTWSNWENPKLEDPTLAASHCVPGSFTAMLVRIPLGVLFSRKTRLLLWLCGPQIFAKTTSSSCWKMKECEFAQTCFEIGLVQLSKPQQQQQQQRSGRHPAQMHLKSHPKFPIFLFLFRW